MIDITELKEPQFTDPDYQAIIRDLIENYELQSGKTLLPAQLERLILNVIAYRENLLLYTINETARGMLLAYARGEILDHLGALLGVERLPASKAGVILKYGFSQALPSDLLIPQGHEVRSKDGKVTFATKEDTTAPAGALSIEIDAEATEAGVIGNGYEIGKITEIVTPLPYVAGVENTSISYGGSDGESDEHLRERIRIAPESFSNAGSQGAYNFWAKTAHQDIVDVSISSPAPGRVRVVPLLKDGKIPDQGILGQVAAVLTDEKVRPLTDQVEVEAPVEVAFQVEAQLTLFEGVDSTLILNKVTENLTSYMDRMKESLGKDVVRSQIITEIQKIEGAYSVTLVHPAADITISDNEVAKGSITSITITGTVSE